MVIQEVFPDISAASFDPASLFFDQNGQGRMVTIEL